MAISCFRSTHPVRHSLLAAGAILAFGLPFPANAETQEQRYFAARDAAIAKVGAAMDAYTSMPSEPPQETTPAPAKGKLAAQDKARAAAFD